MSDKGIEEIMSEIREQFIPIAKPIIDELNNDFPEQMTKEFTDALILKLCEAYVYGLETGGK